jgi:hypothetical protein
VNRSSLLGGLALTGMGAALISVVVSGENLFYVRSNMTVPLLLAGGFMVVLGLAALAGVIVPAHVPRSVVGVLVPICFVLLVRPGPLTVNTGATFDSSGSEPVMTSVVIPTSAIVGPDASADRVAEQAVTIDPGQFLFALDQFGDRFEGVALRMIGQVDHSDPEESRLVLEVLPVGDRPLGYPLPLSRSLRPIGRPRCCSSRACSRGCRGTHAGCSPAARSTPARPRG